MLSLNDVFDATFLQSVRQLRLRARWVNRGGRSAGHRSNALGHGVEYRDFRPYTVGDDLRHVDWNMFRRMNRVMVKVFDEQRDLPVYLLLDASGSMGMPHDTKMIAALRTALAMTAICVRQHDPVHLFQFADDLRLELRPGSGNCGLLDVARRLVALRPGGRTALAAAIRKLSGMPLRRGVLTIVSDFFDQAGVDPILQALEQCRHRLVLIQLVCATDDAPQWRGSGRCRDVETGEAVDVTVTEEVVARYCQAYAAFNDRLMTVARNRRGTLLRLDVEADVVNQLLSLLQPGRPSL